MSLNERRTKIVCTLGPASSNEEVLERLIEAGMNVSRINFSHGTQEDHGKVIELVRKCAKKMNMPIGILQDLRGPKIRLGKFENGSVSIKKGDVLTAYKKECLGNNHQFTIRQPELFQDVKIGDKLLIDDGKVVFSITDCDEESMKVVAINSGVISDNKGINAPGVVLTMPYISEKDRSDALFGASLQVNAVACSFVRRADDVKQIRELLDQNGGKDIEIIAKIENQEGINNIEEIIDAADGIMVARGDMGVEVPFELVPVYQKSIIMSCNKKGKPVITATHMLESMIHCYRPTRAEASDVANAVLDGSDAVMLSGEVAVGDYPVESVQTMATIIKEIEKTVDYRLKFELLSAFGERGINDAVGISVASMALSLKDAKFILAFTDTGGTAKRISHYRPSLPIIALTAYERTMQRISLYWGVKSLKVEQAANFLDYDRIALDAAKKLGAKAGDIIITTSGFGVAHGHTNTVRLLTVK